MRSKRGQAAMEFLMTYGWAILVVLAAIGALAYFGILSPSKFLPNSYTMTGGISAGQYKMDSDGNLTLGLINNMGVQINVTGIEVNTTNTGSDVSGCSNNNATFSSVILANGQSSVQTFGCTSGTSVGNKLKADIKVTYIKSGESVDHTATGSLTTAVEE